MAKMLLATDHREAWRYDHRIRRNVPVATPGRHVPVRQASGSAARGAHRWSSPMSDPGDRPTREDALYESLFGFLRKYGFFIAVVAPLVAGVVGRPGPRRRPAGGAHLAGRGDRVCRACAGAVEASGRVQGRPSRRCGSFSPRCSSSVALFGFAASGAPAALGAIPLGVGIVAWVWSRVARAAGEDTRVFVTRVAGTILGARAESSWDPGDLGGRKRRRSPGARSSSLSHSFLC